MPSSAPRSKRISHSADSCWSIRVTAWLPTPWSGNGTTSFGRWPRHVRNESGRDSRNDVVLDEAIRERLVALTTDFRKLWDDPATANRERKRILAHIIEDATLIKLPAEGITKIHVRFKGGKTETLTTLKPKSSAQQIRTKPEIVELVDQLLDHHVYSEIAAILDRAGASSGRIRATRPRG